VAVPYEVSFKKAIQFAQSKAGWIKRYLKKMKQYETEFSANSKADDGIDKVEAKNQLTRKLRQLAEIHGFSYNRVFIRNQKTRWGSCSSKNNISLNMKLTRLPDELIEYVILHELVHTRKKDHSIAFWVEMDKLVGNGKQMASRLRKHNIGLY
jgi:predicted metal-dependent hydrolase